MEPQRRARALLVGLLAELPRRNCWAIAEHAVQRQYTGTAGPIETVQVAACLSNAAPRGHAADRS